jgi:Fe-S-cluster containining protein
MLPPRDKQLVQIVDAALADATNRALRDDGSSWLACRVGCTACCHGVFRISMLDAERLRAALHALEQEDQARAKVIRMRALQIVDKLKQFYPGNALTGILDPEENGTWDDFADLAQADAPCPVLDPETGRCELYAGRPLTCRIFGPPVQNENGIGVCELCYVGASEADVMGGEMILPHHALEEELGTEIAHGETIIAWALVSDRVEMDRDALKGIA